MACKQRAISGNCDHLQCAFKDPRARYNDCVEIRGGFCKSGLNCVDLCAYSYTRDLAEKARRAFGMVENGGS